MATFTEKEKNLLMETILKEHLGITLADDIKDLRSKTNIFEVVRLSWKTNLKLLTRTSKVSKKVHLILFYPKRA